MITPSPFLVAILGASTVLVIAVGLLAPGLARRRELAERLTMALGSPAVSPDLAGGRGVRGTLRTAGPASGRVVRFLERRLEAAALDLSATELAGAIVLLALSGALVGFVVGGALASALGAAIGASVPFLWMHLRTGRLHRSFRSQLADSVSLLASSVRAGHSLLQGLEQVSKEAPEPSASAFAQVVREIGLGAAQEEALERLAARYPSEDLQLIVTATNVQHQVGGSLARVLDDIATTLRERARIEGDINALTAQQRYSAYVLALLPVFVAVALFLISRDYIELLFVGALRYAAILAAVLVVVGFVLMRRLATIDV
jgi:tight adherence protein B